MKSPDHPAFIRFVLNEAAIQRAERISGSGCYLLMVQIEDDAKMNQLLDAILEHGNYQLNLSIGTLKE